jgi:putative tributyrin esterase
MPLCELKYKSEALGKHTAANVILPHHDTPGPWPVMFLLHGLSDDYSKWMRYTSIERYVEGTPLVVVMPDGGRGFYCDAVEGFLYATAIGTELPRVIKSYFPVSDEWCVAGLSMGGYGAVRVALDHPELFRSATSLSGALAFGHYERARDDVVSESMMAEFGRIVGPNPRGGPNDLFAKFAALAPERRPALRIDCGTEDFLLDQNRLFHAFLDEQGFAHEYLERPGSHEWSYWDEHIQSALEFHLRQLGVR